MVGEPNLRNALRVEPGAHVDLRERNPSNVLGWEKDEGKAATDEQLERLNDLHDRFWAEGKHGLLVVMQGMDASGKDGAIRHVASAFNPQGIYVASFKVPTPEEAAHDFLWRVHKRVPGKGEIALFNRSHYEDVLIVRVNELVPREVWSGRYELIRDFERLLVSTGTVVVKFMLHINRDEQRERFQERFDDPRKRWKFSLGDLEVRERWDDYMAAYEDALAKTSTDDAPWYVIPANKNWFRDLAISTILADTFADLKPEYPQPKDLPETLTVE
jgi:PPK2 family polyphosphate:nucleotide phosphotransferase